ncbi:metabotropic glutamate receptor 3-like, partial [Amphibalanus amphitrite]|uniref:metabotropic glutamate receptor 3-like n=1 Tax=Amphibalanus amphitrite TaxID=1232801 RepID=UPI001C9001F9
MTVAGRNSGAPPLVRALVPTLVLVLTITSGLISAESSEPRVVQLPGNVTFGGLFPMHEQRSSDGQATCGKIKEEKGIQRLEAMLWAVDEINRDPRLLPGIEIGVRILDTCSSGTYALEQSMEFVRSNMNQ